MALKNWSTTAASNATVDSINWAEGQAPSTVNNSARAEMADVRAWYEDAEWRDFGHTPTYISATSFSVTGDKSAIYVVGRRLRCADSSTLYATISAVAYASVTTVTVVMDSGILSASLTGVALGETPTNKPIPMTAIFGIQRVEATPLTAYTNCATAMVIDDTIPQNTEGDQILTCSITPKSATSRLVIDVSIPFVYSVANPVTALFKTGSADAIAIAYTSSLESVRFYHELVSGSTSEQTFTVRIGSSSAVEVNGSGAARLFGGAAAARMSITELGV